MKGREILAILKDVRDDLEAIRSAIESTGEDGRPTNEDAGIVFVSVEHAIELVNELELDLIAEQVGA